MDKLRFHHYDSDTFERAVRDFRDQYGPYEEVTLGRVTVESPQPHVRVELLQIAYHWHDVIICYWRVLAWAVERLGRQQAADTADDALRLAALELDHLGIKWKGGVVCDG